VTGKLPVPASLYPFKGRFADVGGHALHYLDEGPSDHAATLVMVHGNPTWSFYYRHLVGALAYRYRCLVPDHIGCGLSDKPDDARYRYTLDSRVADFDAFLAAAGAERDLTLIAHDWGGMIAMAWAVEHPERVKRLVLMNTAAFHLPASMHLPPSLWSVRNTRLGAWCVQRFNLFARGATRLAVARRMPKEIRDAYCAPYETYDDRLATLRFVQDIPLRPDDPAYATVSKVESGLDRFRDIPILLLWGMKDFVFRPEVLSIFENRWPKAEVERYPQAGHYVLEDEKERIALRIDAFLTEHAAPR
jgi:pimeloyl-ACP methyl ester carboxylesterase